MYPSTVIFAGIISSTDVGEIRMDVPHKEKLYPHRKRPLPRHCSKKLVVHGPRNTLKAPELAPRTHACGHMHLAKSELR